MLVACHGMFPYVHKLRLWIKRPQAPVFENSDDKLTFLEAILFLRMISFYCLFVCFAVLRFEVGASHSLGRCSTT
jgi:hypothetical protein